jgi:geranylgeranylglycerol-phosphate geranylgeranyltransferase
MIKFMKEYVRSMRLYYSFVTGMAGWIGLAYYERSSGLYVPVFPAKIVILFLAFLSWGINQVINDYLGLKEDRINAPDRPMVTGTLDPLKALMLSIALIMASAVVTLILFQPFATIFLFAGVLLNVLYETAKGHGLLGNLVFGVMISMVTLYALYAPGPVPSIRALVDFMPALFMLWLINGLMTFYTYFKDYRGDRKAGKDTLIVIYGLKKARVIALAASFIPAAVFLIMRVTRLLPDSLSMLFIVLGSLVVALQVWTGIRFYLKPVGKATYTALGTNFKACVCGEAALIALYQPILAVILFAVSYCAVSGLFLLYRNAKA